MKCKTETEAVERNWRLDLDRKEICLRHTSWLSRVLMRALDRRTKVGHLYRWFQDWLSTKEGIVFDNGATRDSIHVNGVPRKYQLAGGWTIREADLPFLSNGPLVAADGKSILVPAYSLQERVITWAKILGAIVGLVAAILKLISQLPA
jgi:hypothetical protein